MLVENSADNMSTPKIDLGVDRDEIIKMQKIDFKIKPKQEKKLSPLLSAEEKNLAWNLGQSMDSKKVTSALGYLDLKQICYCLAKAINKHIEFSKGFYFLDDLKQIGDDDGRV